MTMTTRTLPFSQIPSQPGTYVLIMQLRSPVPIQVGRLGTFHCPVGWYLYVGSARGPGGLAARLARHRRRHKRPHWHIDYLLDVANLMEVWWMVSPRRWECVWAETLGRLPDISAPMARFGASDCRCPAHLLYVVHRPSFALTSRLEGEGAVHRTVATNSISQWQSG
jgi:Uri superfamily endonuclease